MATLMQGTISNIRRRGDRVRFTLTSGEYPPPQEVDIPWAHLDRRTLDGDYVFGVFLGWEDTSFGPFRDPGDRWPRAVRRRVTAWLRRWGDRHAP